MLTQIWSVRHKLLSFQVIFLSFVPLLTPKIKVWKNVKKTPGDITFYTCAPLIKIISCMVLEILSATDRISLSSLAIFCPLTAQKQKI